MKHVFVETNFLVGLLRPRPDRAVVDLFRRNDGAALQLYIPWCSASEAHRTLADRVIREDLGFTDAMMAFALRRWLADKTAFSKVEIDKLRALADEERAEAFSSLNSRIAASVAAMTRIDPSLDVVTRTLQVFAIKTLKPFDEMVLGAVLTKATDLHAQGERELYFCELDKDLRSQHPPLDAAYDACGLTVMSTFDVP